jgi:hypothetical protein
MESPKHPFQGEVMLCDVCGFMQDSDPTVESGWYLLIVDGKEQYVCPRCFGGEYTPHCAVCQRFYHPDYDTCPWCNTGVVP